MTPWKKLRGRSLIEHSRFFRAEEHAVELPDGRVIEDWPVVFTPDYANILAVTRDGRFIGLRQTKYLIPGEFIAVPGGYLEPGEDPLAAARRELREETGCTGGTWHDLGRYLVDSNRGCGHAHLFLAVDVERTAEREADDLEEQHVVLLERMDLEKLLDEATCPVLAWTTLLALGLRKLDQLKRKD